MKILIINGSPRKEKGNTQILVDNFIKGAETVGADCETIFTEDLDVKNCKGCFGCWKVTPGECVIKDDMADVLGKIRNCDVLVWASPLYHFSMTAELKKVIERTLPFSSPYIVNTGSKYSHPRRFTDIPQKYVIISNCGFPEIKNFDAMMKQFDMITGNKIVGKILCTAGEFLKTPYMKIAGWYLDAVVKAGEEVASLGYVTDSTGKMVARDFIDIDTFLKYANPSWQVPGEKAPSVDEAKNGISAQNIGNEL